MGSPQIVLTNYVSENHLAVDVVAIDQHGNHIPVSIGYTYAGGIVKFQIKGEDWYIPYDAQLTAGSSPTPAHTYYIRNDSPVGTYKMLLGNSLVPSTTVQLRKTPGPTVDPVLPKSTPDGPNFVTITAFLSNAAAIGGSWCLTKEWNDKNTDSIVWGIGGGASLGLGYVAGSLTIDKNWMLKHQDGSGRFHMECVALIVAYTHLELFDDDGTKVAWFNGGGVGFQISIGGGRFFVRHADKI